MEAQAYAEIIKILKKHKDVIVYDVDAMEIQAKNHLFGIELKEKYGFNIEPKGVKSLEWVPLSRYINIGLFGKKQGRTVSWSDDGRQPENELLLYISFSTGAYIFGEDYPVDLFARFFNELKGYNPKYTDTTNKSLYYSLDNAGVVSNDFEGILKKYYEINKEDFKQRKIQKMKEELSQLEGQP